MNSQIEQLQSVFPVNIPAGEERQLDVFFPLAPSPAAVTVFYTDSDGEHSLLIDTRSALKGLHLETAAP